MAESHLRKFAGLDGSSLPDPSAPEQIEDLAYLNRMTTLGSVVATVVHDLNNVLQTISGSVELMQGRDDLSPYAADKLARVASQASRAMTMVADLAAFARREHGAAPSTDLTAVLDRAMALRRRHLASARIAMTVEPQAGAPVMVRATEQQMLQLVLNLLINAEEALRGRDHPKIEVRIGRAGNRVRLTVADNGPGVPDAMRGQLFEPFSTTRPAGQGVGLGLAVAAAVVGLNGGSVRLERGELGGAEVTVDLPEARQ
jgi:C4-dicarboxylate-specific signal transduction histidine kinase